MCPAISTRRRGAGHGRAGARAVKRPRSPRWHLSMEISWIILTVDGVTPSRVTGSASASLEQTSNAVTATRVRGVKWRLALFDAVTPHRVVRRRAATDRRDGCT